MTENALVSVCIVNGVVSAINIRLLYRGWSYWKNNSEEWQQHLLTSWETIWGTPQTSRTITKLSYWGVQVGPIIGSPLCRERGYSLSDSDCDFFKPGRAGNHLCRLRIISSSFGCFFLLFFRMLSHESEFLPEKHFISVYM